ncbi:NAD(P)H-binding protein [Allonocardiopsis opalescens]|uniref:NAD(P)H dehydrogenase (Quinone) n=1 Tax=Allonocardiopsis opalescens TaxID=1144618 RepID=A0A2T0QEU0_9ACTN|nr:NAD(P)H-binding protein [Allonocardiopsis opalescens]PRY02415.1 NAD(P)H dehydrogenase (quinone) [Allonocardiopsis opalescens]
MIVVTGGAGRFGRLVVRSLLARGVPAAGLAVAVRRPEAAAEAAALGVAVRTADYDRPDTLAAAFDGAERLLLVSANGADDRRVVQHRAAAAAAARAGVGLVAYTSITRADANPLGSARVHRDAEAALAAHRLPAVLLRNGWYTENYTATLCGAAERGEIVGCAGDGRIASATRADLAEAAAAVLTRDGQAGRVYELTGETAWSLPELAAAATVRSGREVVYTDLAPDRYADYLARTGLPPALVDALVDAEVWVAKGALAHTSPDLRGLLGRPPAPLHTAVAAALA